MTKHLRHHASSPVGNRAFTLIELLVVVAIISLLMTLAFPAIAVMQRLTQGGTTETTIGVAVRTASAYAAKPKANLSNPYSGSPASLVSNGAAVLFTPNGDIRILETDRLAFNNASPSIPLQGMSPPRYGYTDVPNRDYVSLPGHAGVVGIVRRDGDLFLLAPPFAVRFDRFGQIASGSNDPGDTDEETHMVFYDANYDGVYNMTTSRRSDTYDPSEWDSRDSNWNKEMDSAKLRPKLPFERIETVVGVLMFNRNDFTSAGHTLEATSGNLLGGAQDWLLATKNDGSLRNARPLFFSRNSGAILKEYR